MADDRLFGKVMKDREKDKTPEILKNFYSVSGALKVSSTLETWGYVHNIPDYIEEYKTLN